MERAQSRDELAEDGFEFVGMRHARPSLFAITPGCHRVYPYTTVPRRETASGTTGLVVVVTATTRRDGISWAGCGGKCGTIHGNSETMGRRGSSSSSFFFYPESWGVAILLWHEAVWISFSSGCPHCLLVILMD